MIVRANFKPSYVLFICCVMFLISSCGVGSTNNSETPYSSTPGTLVLSPLIESSIAVGESTAATVTLSGSVGVTKPVRVTIYNLSPQVASVGSTPCLLTTVTNSCTFSLTGVNSGVTAVRVGANGYQMTDSESLTVTGLGLIYGNEQGLVYKNASLLTGMLPGATLDFGDVLTLIQGKSGSLYAGTNAANGGHVFMYNPLDQLWSMLPNHSNAFGSVDGSNINSLALDLNGNLYAGTGFIGGSGNVFIYKDNTWQQLGSSSLDGTAVNSLVVDSNDILYAGTESGHVFSFIDKTWQPLSDLNHGAIKALALDSSNNLYAGTESGIVAKYSNSSWNTLNNCDSPVNTLVLASDIIYAGTESGDVWQSGDTWSNLGNPDPNHTPVNALAVDRDNNLYSGTSGLFDGIATGQVYRYSSNSWSPVSNLNITYNTLIGWVNTSGVKAILVESNNSIYAATSNWGHGNYGNGGGMVYYQNLSSIESWQVLGLGSIDGTEINSVAVDKNGNYYAGTAAGVYAYNNRSWKTLIPYSKSDSGNGAANLLSIAVDNNGNVYGGAFTGYIYEYVLQTESVTRLESAPYSEDGAWYQLALDNNNDLYVAYGRNSPSSPYVYKYVPDSVGGGTYAPVGTNGPNDVSNLDYVTSIVINSNNDIFVSSGELVWEYPKNGTSWNMVGLGSLDGSLVTSLALDKQNNLYAATFSDITSTGNVFEYISSLGVWDLIASVPLGAIAIGIDSSDNIYVVSGSAYVGLTATISVYSESAFIPRYFGNYAPMFNNSSIAAGI